MAAPVSNETTEFTASLLLGEKYVLSAKGTGGVWYEPTIGSGITEGQLNCDNDRKAVTLTPTADEVIRVWRGGTLDFQIEKTTGHTDENIPGDYVSVGLSEDHGNTIDGLAYFNYANANTVDGGGVVTETKGADLTTDWGARFEPARTNYADGADDLSGGPETVDLTAGGTGDYTLSVKGTAAVTVAEGTATGTGFGQATEGNPVTFNLTVAGTVTLTLNSGTLDKVEAKALKQVEKGSTATSFILTSGSTGSRTADDGSGMFAFANFDITQGSFVVDIQMAADETQGLLNFANATVGVLSFDKTSKFITNDGTNQASVDPNLAANLGDVIRVSVLYSVANGLRIGYRNVTDAGSWVWDTSSAAFDGAFTSDSVFNVCRSVAVSTILKGLNYYNTDVGEVFIEANY